MGCFQGKLRTLTIIADQSILYRYLRIFTTSDSYEEGADHTFQTRVYTVSWRDELLVIAGARTQKLSPRMSLLLLSFPEKIRNTGWIEIFHVAFDQHGIPHTSFNI